MAETIDLSLAEAERAMAALYQTRALGGLATAAEALAVPREELPGSKDGFLPNLATSTSTSYDTQLDKWQDQNPDSDSD